eukprot:TRINITY_DN61447_c0_g1_i1.p1 TRINITY_DN61447_c0_g1~~TRINITY_DN61447_c0_g1_i1.p1  ORF type:complete len:560 (+),score=80.96 TRINITY_DN61447_c0_g1_i1:106-1785(+)
MGNVCQRRSQVPPHESGLSAPRPKSRLLEKAQDDSERDKQIIQQQRKLSEDAKEVANLDAADGSEIAECERVPAVTAASDEMEQSRITTLVHKRVCTADEELSGSTSDANDQPPVSSNDNDGRRSSASCNRPAAFRNLVTHGDVAAIELVMRLAKDVLQKPQENKYRSIRFAALQKRLSGEGVLHAASALQAAGFTMCQEPQRLELQISDLASLRDLVRLLERTRGAVWTPTKAAGAEEPEPDPSSWHILTCPQDGGYIIKQEDAELWSQTFRRTGQEARTWRGGQTPRVVITFINMSASEKILFSWIDSRSLTPKEESWGELVPGGKVEQNTFVSHAWVLRLSSGVAVSGYVPVEPGPGAHHVVAIGRRRDLPKIDSFERLASDRMLEVRENATSWRDTAATHAERRRDLPSRAAEEHWSVVAWPPLSGMEVSEAEADVWAGTHRGVGMEGRTWRGAQTPRVELVFVNCGTTPVGVSWLDCNNNWKERWDYDIEPGESKQQGTFIYHAFVFRDREGRAVGGYVPMDVGSAAAHIVFCGLKDHLPRGEELRRRAEELMI